MSKAGQATFKGINAQAKAAFLLFLQRLSDNSFTHVHLEAADWEDFNLHFSNRKIVCEVKAHKKKMSFADLKEIIEKIASRKGLKPEDEIIVACTGVGPKLRQAFDRLKEWQGILPNAKKPFSERGYSREEIELLLRTSFYEFDLKTLARETEKLLYQQLQFWVPDHQIRMLRDALLVNYVYDNSAIGQEFTRQELLAKIDEFRQEKIRESALYDDDKRQMEIQLATLIKAVESEDLAYLSEGQLTALTAQPAKMSFMIEKVEARLDKDELEKWDFLWRGLLKGWYVFKLFRTFENKIQLKADAAYIVRFLKEHFSVLLSNAQFGLYQESAIELVSSILAKHPDMIQEAFDFASMVFAIYGREHRDERRYRGRQQKRQLSELIETLFSVAIAAGKPEMAEKTLGLVVRYFDLAHGDGMFTAYSSKNVFDVLKKFIDLDFEKNLPAVVGFIVGQLNESSSRGKFSGWEGAGPGISMSGDHYSIHDFHFVGYTLEPAINSFYHNAADKEQAWATIKSLCLTTDERKVTPTRPDFLDRSIIDVLFIRLGDPAAKAAEESYDILTEFIKMRRGIPHKTDLVFARLKGAALKADQKWPFIETYLNTEWNKKHLPHNPFVEQMVAEMAMTGYKPAIAAIESWFDQDEYTNGNRITGFLGTQNIGRLVSSEDPAIRPIGIRLFRSYVSSPGFIEKLERFDSFSVAGLLTKIILTDYDAGLAIWKEIAKSKTLSVNQQLLLTSSINRLEGVDADFLSRAYGDFLKPFLGDAGNDIKKILKVLDHDYAREAIVEFADKLAKEGLFDEAMEIAHIFIADPSPRLENDTDDPKGLHNYHAKLVRGEDVHSISTVRGWVGWVLHDFCVLGGRGYIPEIFDLTKKLAKDENYYVRSYAFVILTELARIRHTVMPENRDERFLSQALADDVESFAFELLDDKENQKVQALMDNLARVFNNIRALNTQQALKVLTTFRDCGFDDVLAEVAPLFLFFAEFRADAFSESKWLYLGTFDSKPIKDLMTTLLRDGSKDVRRRFAWQFWRLLDEAAPVGTEVPNVMSHSRAFEIAFRYLTILSEKYEPETYGSVYYFIDAAIDNYFDECLRLYELCVKTERAALEKEFIHVTWLSHTHRNILDKIAARGKDADFLNLLEEMSSYRTYVWEDLSGAVQRLKKFPKDNKQVGRIFENLIKRLPSYYESKQDWLKQ